LVQVKQFGEIDLIIRALEDERARRATDDRLMSGNIQLMLSEIWIGGIYAILFSLNDKKVGPDNPKFADLFHRLTLLRVPIEKQQIAKDNELRKRSDKSLTLMSWPPNNNDNDLYVYSRDDPQRTHIMAAGITPSGSIAWKPIDLQNNCTQLIDRRSLSDSFLDLWTTT
jgi:hypothetical protein